MPWDQVMHKWKSGTLRSGSTGKPVKSHDQAVAIMLSEKRKAAEGHAEYKSNDGREANPVSGMKRRRSH